MDLSKIRGIIAALVTPFTEDQRINKKAVRILVNYLIENAVSGILVVGGAGECSALNFKEKKELFETVVDENDGRVPIYAGTGGVTTAKTIELTKLAQNIGVDIITILPPYSINPSEDELYNHFKEVASNTSLPIVLYNHPKRTGINLSVELVSKLSKIDNIIGIKDSSGDFTLTIDYLKLNPDKLFVFEGIDTLILAGLVYGAQGSISSVACAFPKIVVKIYQSYLKGDFKTAIESQNKLIPFRNIFSLGTFPSVLKEALNIIGIPVGKPRLPVRTLDPGNKKKVREILNDIIH
jgi:4-hydroxy-tetrahydrodipicolinate synthase